MSKRITILVVSLAAVVLAGVSVSCQDECSGRYVCPAIFEESQILVPEGTSSPLVSLTATPPCETNFVPGDLEIVLVVRFTRDRPSSAPSCTVHGRLADGTELTGSVLLESLPCCGVTMEAPAITLRPEGGSTN
jgi:hypothetical protein